MRVYEYSAIYVFTSLADHSDHAFGFTFRFVFRCGSASSPTDRFFDGCSSISSASGIPITMLSTTFSKPETHVGETGRSLRETTLSSEAVALALLAGQPAQQTCESVGE